MESLEKDVFDTATVNIDDIDLAVLGRMHRIILRYFEFPPKSAAADSDEGMTDSLRMKFLEFATGNGPFSLERDIAYRMLFEEMLAAPDYVRKVDAFIGKAFKTENEEITSLYEETTTY